MPTSSTSLRPARCDASYKHIWRELSKRLRRPESEQEGGDGTFAGVSEERWTKGTVWAVKDTTEKRLSI